MTTPEIYDYAIVGAGAAGLQLAYALASDSYFNDKQVLIIDREEKSGNDHTWSYWEKGKGHYDDILWNSWTSGSFHGKSKSKSFNLHPYIYKTLRSSAFYDFMKVQLNKQNLSLIHI